MVVNIPFLKSQKVHSASFCLYWMGWLFDGLIEVRLTISWDFSRLSSQLLVAWDLIHSTDKQIKQAVVTYRTARQAIGELGGAVNLKRFQEITKSDLRMSGDIPEENRVGQRSSVLPWFWRLDRKVKKHHRSYENECKYYDKRSSIQYL